jgi:5-methylcytosine-specific restriction endonuclease McrA
MWLARREAEDAYFIGTLPMYPGFTEKEIRYARYRKLNRERADNWDVMKWAEHWVEEDISKAFCAYISANGHTWGMDHTIPVCEGGGCCDLSNLRTLCLPCHRKETAALAKRRAELRRQKKALPELLLK